MLSPQPRWPFLTWILHAGYRQRTKIIRMVGRWRYVRKLALDAQSKVGEICTCNNWWCEIAMSPSAVTFRLN
jgi:hypothetical protein